MTETQTVEQLEQLTRTELDKLATDEGIENPGGYDNKGEVAQSIFNVRNGEAALPLPQGATPTGGATVTFKGMEDESDGTRSVRVGDFRFVLDTPVEKVDDETVGICQGLEGHKFDVE